MKKNLENRPTSPSEEIPVRGKMDRCTAEAVRMLKHAMLVAVKKDIKTLEKSGLIEPAQRVREAK